MPDSLTPSKTHSDSFIYETFPSPFRSKPSKTVCDVYRPFCSKLNVKNGLGWNGDGNISKMKESLY